MKIHERLRGLICPACLIAIAVCAGLYDVGGSGALWPDAPRYTNAGAMMHDWLGSDELVHPVRFAMRNYQQYPAFSVPYHPPAYPFALALFFVVAGVSYTSARLFVALCLGMAACAFYGILRRFGIARAGAFLCALLLLLTPEIVRWTRDTMAEIPGLGFILLASYFFVGWERTSRPWRCWLAFALAAAAMLSRVLTAGVVPCWFLYLVAIGGFRRLKSPHLLLAAALYVAIGGFYVTVLLPRYAKYETDLNMENQVTEPLSWEHLTFYPRTLPDLVGWGTLAAAAVGAVAAVRFGRRHPPGVFWGCWLLSTVGFQYAMYLKEGLHNEPRFFLYTLPALPGLVAVLFDPAAAPAVRRRLAPALVVLGLIGSLPLLAGIPRGVVGLDATAETLARLEKPGNVLVATDSLADLIFRARAADPDSTRRYIRSDRSLAIRLSGYTLKDPVIQARTVDDVVKFIQEGRARYLVTCAPDERHRDDDIRGADLKLAHDAASATPSKFRLVGESPLLIEFGLRGEGLRYRIFVWEYLGVLPEGPGTLPTVVPTADLVLPPAA